MTYSLTFQPSCPDSNGLSDVVFIKVNEKSVGTIFYNSHFRTWGLVMRLYGGIFHDSERDPRTWKSLDYTKTFDAAFHKNTIYNRIVLEVSDLITFFNENLA